MALLYDMSISLAYVIKKVNIEINGKMNKSYNLWLSTPRNAKKSLVNLLLWNIIRRLIENVEPEYLHSGILRYA